jgi:hypothetical protein
VSREYAIWVGAAVLLLTVGLLVGSWFLTPPDNADVGSFRQWFWGNRSLDLLVQVGLILTGALGIAALLPWDKKEDS